jgi:hypothetical protein
MQSFADPAGTELRRAADELAGPVTPPSAALVHAAALHSRRRRLVGRSTVLVASLAAAVTAGFLFSPASRESGLTYADGGTELGAVVVPDNVQHALTGYDNPSGYRPGDPVDLLARVNLPGGLYIASVRPHDRSHFCAIDYIGPAGDGLTGACGRGTPTPYDTGSHQMQVADGSSVDTIAWVSGAAPRETALVTLTDALGTLEQRTFDGGPNWDSAQFFIIPLTSDHARLPKTFVARRADGTETARLQEPGSS